MKGYEGDVAMLGKTEQFFLAIAGVPRFQIRTRCMLIRATFPEKEAELKEKLKAVSAAADEVRTSMCLKVVLEYTLALGNYLNGTSNKGAAWGFKLETLNKLQGTKSTDNKTTLLHYLARLYEAEAAKASDPETFSLSATMPNLEMAARTVWKDDGAELAQLTAALKQVETQVKVDKVAAFTSSMGRFQTSAKEKEMALTEMKTKTDANLKELKKWFGEPEKTEPEEVFSTLHNFVLMFEKARKYNKEMDALEKKQKMRDAAKAAGGVAAFAGAADGGGGRLKVNRPGPAQMGVNSELAAALGKRNKNLVDGAVDGMANGTLLNARRRLLLAARRRQEGGGERRGRSAPARSPREGTKDRGGDYCGDRCLIQMKPAAADAVGATSPRPSPVAEASSSLEGWTRASLAAGGAAAAAATRPPRAVGADVVDHDDDALGLDAGRGADAEHVVAVRRQSVSRRAARLLAALHRLLPARQVPRVILLLVRPPPSPPAPTTKARAPSAAAASRAPRRGRSLEPRAAFAGLPPPPPDADAEAPGPPADGRSRRRPRRRPPPPPPATARAAGRGEGSPPPRRWPRGLGLAASTPTGTGTGDGGRRRPRRRRRRRRPPPPRRRRRASSLHAALAGFFAIASNPASSARRPGSRVLAPACRRGRRRACSAPRGTLSAAARARQPFEMMLFKSRCACVPLRRGLGDGSRRRASRAAAAARRPERRGLRSRRSRRALRRASTGGGARPAAARPDPRVGGEGRDDAPGFRS